MALHHTRSETRLLVPLKSIKLYIRSNREISVIELTARLPSVIFRQDIPIMYFLMKHFSRVPYELMTMMFKQEFSIE